MPLGGSGGSAMLLGGSGGWGYAPGRKWMGGALLLGGSGWAGL